MSGLPVNGMTEPLNVRGWKTIQTADDQGRITSAHQIPAEQFVHSAEDTASCLCGPQVAYTETEHGPVPIVTHFALDVAYYPE